MQSVYEALQTEVESLELVSHHWFFHFCLALFYLRVIMVLLVHTSLNIIVFCPSHGFVLDTKNKTATTKLKSECKSVWCFEFLES